MATYCSVCGQMIPTSDHVFPFPTGTSLSAKITCRRCGKLTADMFNKMKNGFSYTDELNLLQSLTVEADEADPRVQNYILELQRPDRKAPEMQTSTKTELNDNLFLCPDCGGIVSINAEACPHCGRLMVNRQDYQRRNAGSSRKGISIFGVVFAIVLAGLILWYLIAPFSTPLWLQKIGGTIRCFFTGESSYLVFNPHP